ncbi:hypothetical protein [Streptomyces paludis]|uniref:hypothetical protein n=1 Tax=Streptomyces paludis TaxID=2282738 RepID=UPI0013B40AFC|nr:hypothetical protein [Streptomyces paludis]
MSYRHSSYRKLRKAYLREEPSGHRAPVDAQRIEHWRGLPRPPKNPDWGRPRPWWRL